MEGLLPVSLNTITVNGEIIQRQAQTALNIKIAVPAIVVCLTPIIQTGEITGLPSNQDQEVHSVVARLGDHPVAAHDPAVAVVAGEEGTKKILLQAHKFSDYEKNRENGPLWLRLALFFYDLGTELYGDCTAF